MCTTQNPQDLVRSGELVTGDTSVDKRSISSEGGYFGVQIGKAGVVHARGNTTSVSEVAVTSAATISTAQVTSKAGGKGCGRKTVLFALAMLAMLAVRV